MADKSTLEKMVSIASIRTSFKDKKVLLTGHTGFKGSWLLQILAYCGARVTGLALAPEKPEDLYNQIDGDSLCAESVIHDIRDADFVQQLILRVQPDFIFHLAAQPLVLKGYQDPLYTYAVNTLGTAHVLDALRFLPHPCVAVMVTTDKVYENPDDGTHFKETDPLGGYDPYSASKAACELIIASYRNSFFSNATLDIHRKSIVSVRAGNVIGGGDYADHRIIPDIIRALHRGEDIVLRNPNSTRPWQHVLEPLAIYLELACRMVHEPGRWNSAYNIGPLPEDVLSVEDLTREAIQIAGRGRIRIEQNSKQPHEAALLMLDVGRIQEELGWKPVYSAKEAIEQTISWYFETDDAGSRCLRQIKSFFGDTIEGDQNGDL
ncbi:MAG: CDP-glucose 4,6-dehydratase [Chitinophagaceae bacterium]|nr:CDP-glucose 4,6-dehydratase [Chitinophagaceae bacterium]